MSVEQDIASLQSEFAEVKKDLEIMSHLNRKLNKYIEDFQSSVSSRRGLPGVDGRSIVGPAGPAGRDAFIKIQTADGKIQAVDMNGKVHAEIIAVAGPKGDPGQSITGPAGKNSVVPGPVGRPGVSPNVDEVVAKVVAKISAKLA